MKKICPCCDQIELRQAIRRGVEIDYCPECNGIWLDNGELSKIVAESVQAVENEDRPAAIATKKSKESIFKSFLNIIGSTKNDDETAAEDPDFISGATPDAALGDDSKED
ncbi:MAG: hypothetical protein D3923_01005 [Candidatus Electrothrix sp. AR3]|nr:hypothetical protein [Candidatus Electrothrix sp. AR3]